MNRIEPEKLDRMIDVLRTMADEENWSDQTGRIINILFVVLLGGGLISALLII